jgi:hypothetical protein
MDSIQARSPKQIGDPKSVYLPCLIYKYVNYEALQCLD